MQCPRCKSYNVSIQNVTRTKIKNRGCFGWFLWILLAICTVGLIIIIPLLTNSKVKSKSYPVAICQNCGRQWKI